MFKIPKLNIFKELRENMIFMSSQIGNPSKEIKTREKPNGNSLELRSTTTEIKTVWVPHQIEEVRRKSLSKLQA